MESISQTMPLSRRTTEISPIARPLMLENCFNWILLGVLTVQVYVYSIAFPKDRWVIKIIVYLMYLLEALQSCILLVNDVQSFAKGFENPEALFEANTLWLIPVLTGLVTFICQGLFAYRIWFLAEHGPVLRIEFYSIAISCMVQLVCSLIQGFSVRNIAPLDIGRAKPPFKIISTLWCSSAALGDVFIAVCMIHLLFQIKENPYNPTRRVLQRIVRLTIGTGSLTAIISILTLLLLFCSSHLIYFQITLATIGKIYSNWMMCFSTTEFDCFPRTQVLSSGLLLITRSNSKSPHVLTLPTCHIGRVAWRAAQLPSRRCL